MSTIYLVSYYFAPLGRADGVNRTYLVKSIAEDGWKFQIITGIDYRSLILNFQKDESLLKILPASVEIQRFESDQGWLPHDLKQILKFKNNWRTHWIKKAEDNFSFKGPGVFMAVVPPADNAILAYNLSKKYRTPLALYYPDDVFDVPAHIVKETKVIFCVTPQIKQRLENHYGHPRIIVVEHGVPEKITCTPKNSIQMPIKMIYAGSFNFRTRPELILKAYNALEPQVKSNLIIDFYGPSGYYYWLFLKPLLKQNAHFKGYVPFEKLQSILPEYDIGLTVNHADVAFPSKVFYYLNAGLPIFAITEHRGLIDFIHQHKVGLTSGLETNLIKDKLHELVSNPNQIHQWHHTALQIREKFLLRNSVKIIDQTLRELT